MDPRLAHADRSPPVLRERIEDLFARDRFSAALDIRLVEADRGRSLLEMTVSDARMNAHGGCHGGAIWTLADMAFGAAGYYDGPMLTVGSNLTFIRPAPRGSHLYAKAAEVARKGKTGAFQVVVATDPVDVDSVVASGMFTGRWIRPS